jgi:mannose-6-phosphate isomerase-like protein (cupin superfamily)
MEKKNFNQPDKSLNYEKGKADIVATGGFLFQRITTEAGWRWSKNMKPLAGTDSCHKSHVIYMISGRLGFKMDDGKQEEFGPGDIAVIQPGHDTWTIGSEPAVALEISY